MHDHPINYFDISVINPLEIPNLAMSDVTLGNARVTHLGRQCFSSLKSKVLESGIPGMRWGYDVGI